MNPIQFPIFRFKNLEPASGRYANLLRARKREAIERIGGFVLTDTAQEVDSSDLDGNGFLKREKMHS